MICDRATPKAIEGGVHPSSIWGTLEGSCENYGEYKESQIGILHGERGYPHRLQVPRRRDAVDYRDEAGDRSQPRRGNASKPLPVARIPII